MALWKNGKLTQINNGTKTFFTTAPKYKMLTEFVGHDFDKQGSVYVTRTDTAGRFFSLPNTPAEQKMYNKAKDVYREFLAQKKVDAVKE